MTFQHSAGSREIQDRFDTRRLADAISDRTVHDRLSDHDRLFIERMDMFFIASEGASGMLDCSYKGGDTGFVHVLDESTLAFPNYDGNARSGPQSGEQTGCCARETRGHFQLGPLEAGRPVLEMPAEGYWTVTVPFIVSGCTWQMNEYVPAEGNVIG
jgi:hypothetical protein